jgi:RimJ/RimL family protein N-acetyltransferase
MTLMCATPLETKRLKLVLRTLEEVQAMLDAITPAERAEVSPAWLARLDRSTTPDPWVHGFYFVRRDDEVVVGQGGFKGPPTDEGVVEIAYGVSPDHQGKGYATEAAEALPAFAFQSAKVRVVCAHTLREAHASARVLTKCGFQYVGEVIDPEDGLVWRWEKQNEVRAA